MPIFNSDFNSDSNKDYYYILFKMLKEPEEEAPPDVHFSATSSTCKQHHSFGNTIPKHRLP